MCHRHLIKPVCVQYGRLFSQKNAFRIQRSRAPERGLSRGNLSPLTLFWWGGPDGSQDPVGKGGAAERWRVAPCASGATRHGAQPATTRTNKSQPPPGRRTDYNLL